MAQGFAQRAASRVVVEVGTHSPWVSRQLAGYGHAVLVANARKLRAIYASGRKGDRVDARTLARVGRLDPVLLAPIRHRGPQAQADRALLLARDVLVRTRTQLVNHVRGAVKAGGGRVPACSAPAFGARSAAHVPEEVRPALTPVVQQLAALTAEIRAYDRAVEQLAATRYPETARLRQVPGVGALTALCFVLTLEDPARFATSRAVGAYVRLCPRQQDSGAQHPQLPITKGGDALLRRLLVGAAHYILGPFGPDCRLRVWGLALASRGGRNAKKRAIVAVARKLATLLHRLWMSETAYDPWHGRPAPVNG
jgi:transposase